MNYQEWESQVPAEMTNDPVWNLESYRLGLFLSDLGWEDATKLLGDKRTLSIADQLYRAIAKISSSICEGYSRGTGKGRVIFYEYAMGSAREARDWYYKSRRVLSNEVAMHRIRLTSSIVGLLVAMCRSERRRGRLEENDVDID
jgi:four helix bundle protein